MNDYLDKTARVVFGPDLAILGPHENFSVLSLSGKLLFIFTGIFLIFKYSGTFLNKYLLDLRFKSCTKYIADILILSIILRDIHTTEHDGIQDFFDLYKTNSDQSNKICKIFD